MILKDFLPCLSLQEYIRFIGIVHFEFAGNISIPGKHYSPRPGTSLCFIAKDPEYVTYPGSNNKIKRPSVFINGQHTVTNTRHCGKEFLALIVHFQPGVLCSLTGGVPLNEFTNTYADAELFFPKEIKYVNEQLNECNAYHEMINVLESFFIKLINRSKQKTHGVDAAAKLILQDKPVSIDWLAKETCLCNKQFERKFKERIGITASTLERIVRFDQTVKMKNAQPAKDWLSIAVQCGYHDYQHMVRDYKAFTSLTPNAFFQLDAKAPESIFGMYEVSQVYTH
jgi:AraC-like DNA-binding protein